MQKITPCLWFDNQAEEAIQFYTSVFPNSRIGEVAYYGENGPGEPGSVMSATFYLDGQEFMTINGGPVFQFTPAISFYVHCQDQAEVDYLWDRLLEGGQAEMCGWLKDQYGVSWQIVPDRLIELMNDPDPEKAARVVKAMLQMQKIDVAGLEAAYDGKEAPASV